jgi:hypothetical protein
MTSPDLTDPGPQAVPFSDVMNKAQVDVMCQAIRMKLAASKKVLPPPSLAGGALPRASHT